MKLTIDLPDNAFLTLDDVARVLGQSRQEYALDMIYAMLESDLDGENDLPKKAGKEICESCVYNPKAWRKEP
ncbi:hypothetical protein [Nitrososphaera sp.]|uniref:hypothetical protein n=1 Tax=Nitrososphaera sp. TaxID=1971748 RepID=UPI002ED8ABE8